jgi:hypothetical protein
MASRWVYSIALLTCLAAAWQEEASLVQSAVSVSASGEETFSVQGSFVEGSFGLVSDEAPTWCKNDSQLTWLQRKERMQQHNTLLWAKKMVKQMLEDNSTVPEWMYKIVSEDEKKGKSRWAVQEAQRLKAEGKETPKWMEDLVAEDARWANRWAACKGAELRALGEAVPAWMVENGRKGVLDAASEKAEELQEQIEELDAEKEQEAALVDAQGNATLANQRMLARNREFHTRTLSQQTHALEQDLEDLDRAEGEMLNEGMAPASIRKLKQALRKARAAAHSVSKMLDLKMAKAQGE